MNFQKRSPTPTRLRRFPMWPNQVGQCRVRGVGAASLQQDWVRGPPSEGVAYLEPDQDLPWDEPQGDDCSPFTV